MTLNNLKKIFLWGLVLLFVLIVWIKFPLIFKEWVFKLLVKPPFTPEAFTSLGPIGDIFGALTALLTSLTLIIVIYTAYLQRQANIHAREAMAEQLRQAGKAAENQLEQAKEATKEQLEQAKEATKEQLEQARESTTQQLNLAESTHKAQIKETIYSNFLNTYNSLMNYKLAKYNTIQVFIDGRVWHSEEIFKEIALSFLGEQQIFELQLTRREIGDLYNQTLDKVAGIDKGLNEINSYFLLYESIYELIKNSDISEEEKTFFRKTTSNTMSNHEQLTLLWASVDILDCHELVKDTGIFSHFYRDDLMPFFVTFFEKSCFSQPEIISNWDKYLNNQNPT
ncbi:cell envelope integrity protein TolA [Acinetobacter calcoaceticus]|uniref:cell envelope integrity protein TolA n=1 Tax=Acinetobacter TaxID=469 RepID=UPI0032B348F8